jgi:ATP-dependent DNA helicase RecQ
VKKVYKALVNYLQLPSGSGEGIYFDFDINDFAKKFSLNIYTVNYSLKILEQEEFISYNEQIFLPSTVVFAINKDELNLFERSYPDFEPVIKGLLRSYEGIFDYPSPIYENQLAGFVKKEVAKLKSDLKKLQQFGIIEYHPQKDKPQIQFLRNRINTEDFTINQNNISKRKIAFEKRLKAIIQYVKIKACRSKTIANYFNDISAKPCGICDNCINEKEIVITKTEFENIVEEIKKLTREIPVSSNIVFKNLNMFKKEKVWKVLNYLQAEDKINISLDGLVTKTKHM